MKTDEVVADLGHDRSIDPHDSGRDIRQPNPAMRFLARILEAVVLLEPGLFCGVGFWPLSSQATVWGGMPFTERSPAGCWPGPSSWLDAAEQRQSGIGV